VVTVNELRSVVRTQTQTDANDLPDATIDVYLQQAYERTLNAESRWPFFATSWAVTQLANEAWIDLPGNVDPAGIMALTDDIHGYRLEIVPQVWAEDVFRGNNAGTTSSVMYSVWGDRIYLWPVVGHDVDRAFTLRGYRRPLAWIDVATESPDCDPRLHLPLTQFAVALAYAQQEDEVLEATYMQRWLDDVELAHANIMKPVHHRPLVGAGSISGHIRPSMGWQIVTPAGP
jgi:hypothetical protein